MYVEERQGYGDNGGYNRGGEPEVLSTVGCKPFCVRLMGPCTTHGTQIMQTLRTGGGIGTGGAVAIGVGAAAVGVLGGM